jgi:hypothetical protein
MDRAFGLQHAGRVRAAFFAGDLYSDTVVHSGHLGDIIYSLPFIRMLSTQFSQRLRLVLNASPADPEYARTMRHPAGARTLSRELFEYIEPLLAAQSCIREVVFESHDKVEEIDGILLDAIRAAHLDLKRGVIQGWYRKAFGLPVELVSPWLEVPEGAPSHGPSLIVGRSFRHRNDAIDYRCLETTGEVGFIGLPEEYEDFQARFRLPNLRYLATENALKAARSIRSAHVVIANQSLVFSLAEAIKVPRALEVYEPVPNVVPIGGECIEFMTTDALLYFVEHTLAIGVQAAPQVVAPRFVRVAPTRSAWSRQPAKARRAADYFDAAVSAISRYVKRAGK